ncbi:hypothetical protein OWV82_003292 [Melia azedarach]|uniref:Uncharacterized protein n=1 Tax=Melia azedarach TaxID=155640 RepID=A0ACC1YLD5_MELAZ|nr:hypothetical protein OWV82_003292 [Melia azedarach]
MASSISEAAKEKTVAESASAILEAEPSLKKWKAQMNPETAENASNSSDFSFPPLTTEVSHTVHNMDFAEAPNNVEVPSPRGSDAVDNEFFQIPEGYRQRYDRCIDELEKVNIFDDPAARHELAEFLLIPPEEKNYIEGLTTVEALSYVQECMVKVLVGLFQHRREFYALKGDFEKAKATISDQNAEISALKVNSNKLAKAEAELKENELSWAQLSSRVESLETKLKWKDSEYPRHILDPKLNPRRPN